jgi:hemoglobin
MKITFPRPALAALALLAASCTAVRDDSAATSPPPADGTLAVPADYRSWPVFLAGVERPDAKQVRDIYVNPAGSKAVAGQPFPVGSLFVMEIHKAQEAADGSLARDASGKLVKAGLIKVFVMGKGEGWGDGVTPAELRNGDWIYAAWQPDLKTAAADPLQGCRGCHLPQAANDYVHRAGEYFAGRGR